MSGDPIRELNIGLQTFEDELKADSLAAKRVEVSIVTFGPVQTVVDFTSAATFIAPTLSASGNTPMGEAITTALRALEQRKQEYRDGGVSYYRPWVFLITDGAPTDAWQQAANEIHSGEVAGRFSFYAVGVKGADMAKLAQIAPPSRGPVALDGLRFRDLFSWLSKSMRTVSQSTQGTPVQLSVPGWITANP